MKAHILAIILAILTLATPAIAKEKKVDFRDILSRASLPLYVGKQVCKWSPQEGFFGTDWAWGCEFKSRPICTVTVIDHQGNDYIALTAGHCISPSLRKNKNYYVSDTIESEPVLRKVEILKAENDDRYDFAIIRFQSMKEYPVIQLNGPEDGPPAVGDELVNVNYSFGLGQQVVHGVVTSGLVNVDEMKNRYLTTLQTGPGSSGSAIVDAKTGRIVGVLELGFPRSAMGAGAIPTGKLLFNFMEDDTAGLETQPAVGLPPQEPTPTPLTVREHLAAILESFLGWLRHLFHLE